MDAHRRFIARTIVAALRTVLVPALLLAACPAGGGGADLGDAGRGAHGSLTITKANSSLRVSEAPCPDKLCEKQGPITGSGSIVCIPEGVIIEIITSKEGDSPDALLH